MKKKSILVSVLFCCFAVTSAINPADSIRQQMKHLQGQTLLQAHSNLCRLAAAGEDSNYELRCIREYLAEALKQKDVEAEGLARSSEINCYYNYGMSDSLTSKLPEHLAAMRKNKTWDYYYNSWNVLVELYLYKDKLQTALREAQTMYADARHNKSNYGLGVSSYCMGGIYQTMGRFREAEKSLEESISALSKEEDITQLLSAYNSLGETLDGLGKYDKLRTVAGKWKSILDKYQKEALNKGYTPSLGGRYLYCTLAATVAEIETAHYAKAAELIKLAEEYAQGRKQISRYKLLQVQARYYAATKQYDKAISCNRENTEILAAVGDSVSMLTVQLQQANLLLKAGHYEEAARLYNDFIPHRDKLRNTELANQLDELRTIFEVDKLTLKNQITTTRLYLSLLVGVLLLLTVILYMIYARRLRRKNRILYDTITQSEKAQAKIWDSLVERPEEQLEADERLYRQLCKLVSEEQLFKDPDLNRESLAAKLNTNRTYLADAVKKYADGATITEFINQCRLRYAAAILTNDPSKNMSEVEFMSGFNSRSTFSRLFKDYYGMSPSEYRIISKEKKIDAIE